MVNIDLPWHIHKKTDGVHALYANLFFRWTAVYTFGLFIPLFILKRMRELYAASVPEALLVVAAFYLLTRVTKLLLLFPATKVINLVGTRWSITISNFFLILMLTALVFADERIGFLVLAAVAMGIYIPFYFISYHFILAVDSHDGKRGREVGKTGALKRIAGIIGPLLGGLTTAAFGFEALFGLSVVLVILSSVPPFFMVHHKHDFRIGLEDVFGKLFAHKDKATYLAMGAGAIKDKMENVFWPVLAFLVLADYRDIGFLFSLPSLFTLGVFWAVGWIYDKYSKRRLLSAGVGLNSFVWILRAVATSSGLLYLAETVMRIVHPFLWVPFDSFVYEWAKDKALISVLVREIVYSLAESFWLVFLIGGFWFGLPLRAAFFATAIVIWGHALVLRR